MGPVCIRGHSHGVLVGSLLVGSLQLGHEGHEVMYNTSICVYIMDEKQSVLSFHMPSTVVPSNVKETVISTMSKQPTSPSSESKCHIKQGCAGMLHMESIHDVQ